MRAFHIHVEQVNADYFTVQADDIYEARRKAGIVWKARNPNPRMKIEET